MDNYRWTACSFSTDYKSRKKQDYLLALIVRIGEVSITPVQILTNVNIPVMLTQY